MVQDLWAHFSEFLFCKPQTTGYEEGKFREAIIAGIV